MKIVAKIYFFYPQSPIKESFVDFESDINFMIFQRDKLHGTRLYRRQYYKLKERWTKDENIINFLELNERFLERTNQEDVLNEIKSMLGCGNRT